MVINTRLHQCGLCGLFVILLMFSIPAISANKEQAVKAGLVYNISQYVLWPSYVNHTTQFNLCVIGNAYMGGALKALQGKLVGSKYINVKGWVKSNDLEGCHMVFITKDVFHSQGMDLQSLSELPVLTISDAAEFIHHGGMVGLIKNGTKVGFEVDLKAVRAVGLNMSAQLLKLAKTVEGVE